MPDQSQTPSAGGEPLDRTETSVLGEKENVPGTTQEAASAAFRTDKKKAMIAAAALILVLAVVVTVVVFKKTAKISASGVFDLSSSCLGHTLSYPDIDSGTQITVSVDGKIAGFTDLGVGKQLETAAPDCQYSWTIDGLPKGRVYSFEVGKRGAVNFRQGQLADVEMNLGPIGTPTAAAGSTSPPSTLALGDDVKLAHDKALLRAAWDITPSSSQSGVCQKAKSDGFDTVAHVIVTSTGTDDPPSQDNTLMFLMNVCLGAPNPMATSTGVVDQSGAAASEHAELVRDEVQIGIGWNRLTPTQQQKLCSQGVRALFGKFVEGTYMDSSQIGWAAANGALQTECGKH